MILGRERISDDYVESVALTRFCHVAAVRTHPEQAAVVFDLTDPFGQKLQVMFESLLMMVRVGPLDRMESTFMASAWAGWGAEYPPMYNDLVGDDDDGGDVNG